MTEPTTPSPGREILQRLYLAEKERREEADRKHRENFRRIVERERDEWTEISREAA